LSDPNAQDPTRNVGMVPNIPGYCGCDFTNACDSGCACDPECSGCGCTAVLAGEGGIATSALWMLPLLALALLRSRRRS
jgi:MYXO-CTERM domain-containing protein